MRMIIVSIPHWFDYSSAKIRGCQIHSNKFQFHTGSITAATIFPGTRTFLSFQFHTGSITAEYHRALLRSHVMFQFHTGSITALFALSKPFHLVYVSIPHWFDYSGVLLRGMIFVQLVSIPHWFDYSNALRGRKHSEETSFNSTLVRLQLPSRCEYSQFRHPCFNSTLVRLQLISGALN